MIEPDCPYFSPRNNSNAWSHRRDFAIRQTILPGQMKLYKRWR